MQEALKEELASLKLSYQLVVEDNSTLSAEACSLPRFFNHSITIIASLLGGIQKVTDKGNIVLAIGAALLSVLAVLL